MDFSPVIQYDWHWDIRIVLKWNCNFDQILFTDFTKSCHFQNFMVQPVMKILSQMMTFVFLWTAMVSVQYSHVYVGNDELNKESSTKLYTYFMGYTVLDQSSHCDDETFYNDIITVVWIPITEKQNIYIEPTSALL